MVLSFYLHPYLTYLSTTYQLPTNISQIKNHEGIRWVSTFAKNASNSTSSFIGVSKPLPSL